MFNKFQFITTEFILICNILRTKAFVYFSSFEVSHKFMAKYCIPEFLLYVYNTNVTMWKKREVFFCFFVFSCKHEYFLMKIETKKMNIE